LPQELRQPVGGRVLVTGEEVADADERFAHGTEDSGRARVATIPGVRPVGKVPATGQESPAGPALKPNGKQQVRLFLVAPGGPLEALKDQPAMAI
jgi:hypothetical protein